MANTRAIPTTTAAVASSPKLLDRVRWHLRVKHYSARTEQTYVDWIRRFILFHGKRHPNEMGECEITQFLTHLAVDKHVSASTQNQSFAALLFLYQQVLERKLDFIDNVQRVTRPAKLPVVFTVAEARAVIAQLKGDYRLMAELLYGHVKAFAHVLLEGSFQRCSTYMCCIPKKTKAYTSATLPIFEKDSSNTKLVSLLRLPTELRGS